MGGGREGKGGEGDGRDRRPPQDFQLATGLEESGCLGDCVSANRKCFLVHAVVLYNQYDTSIQSVRICRTN